MTLPSSGDGRTTDPTTPTLEQRVTAIEEWIAAHDGTETDPEPEPEPDPEPTPVEPGSPAEPPGSAIVLDDVRDLVDVPEGSSVILPPGVISPNRVPVPRGVTMYGRGQTTLDGQFGIDVALVLSDNVTIDGVDATRYNGDGWTGGSSDRRAQGQAPFKGPANSVLIRAYNGYNNRHSALRIEGNNWRVSGFRGYDNGQHALTGGGNDAVVELFEWYRNGNSENPLRFFATDRGGSKVTYSNRMLLRDGVCYDHDDMGVWADGNNRNLRLERVISRNNRKNGFNWEVNPGPITMIDCVGLDNGYDEPGNAASHHMRWCQVFISSSGGVTVDGGEFSGRKGVGIWNDWSHHAYTSNPWGADIGCQDIWIIGAKIAGTVLVAGINVLGSPAQWDVLALSRTEKWFEANEYEGTAFAVGNQVVGPSGWTAAGYS